MRNEQKVKRNPVPAVCAQSTDRTERKFENNLGEQKGGRIKSMQIELASRTIGYWAVLTGGIVSAIESKRTIQLHSISLRLSFTAAFFYLVATLQMIRASGGQGSSIPCIQIEHVNEITPCLHEGGTVLQ